MYIYNNYTEINSGLPEAQGGGFTLFAAGDTGAAFALAEPVEGNPQTTVASIINLSPRSYSQQRHYVPLAKADEFYGGNLLAYNPLPSAEYAESHGPSAGAETYASPAHTDAASIASAPVATTATTNTSAAEITGAGAASSVTAAGSTAPAAATNVADAGTGIYEGSSSFDNTTFDEDDPGGPIDPPSDTDQPVPLDGGLTLLLAAGIGIGLKQNRKKEYSSQRKSRLLFLVPAFNYYCCKNFIRSILRFVLVADTPAIK